MPSCVIQRSSKASVSGNAFAANVSAMRPGHLIEGKVHRIMATRPMSTHPVKPLNILVAHTHYRERGGEDVAVEAEIELLRCYGHQVTTVLRNNELLDRIAPHQQLRETLWSSQTVRDISDAIRDQRPDVIHVHNTFPSLSPAIYWAGAAARVPIVQTLHNFRLLCVQAMF